MSFFSDVQLQSGEVKRGYQPGLPDRAALSFLFTANDAWKTQTILWPLFSSTHL